MKQHITVEQLQELSEEFINPIIQKEWGELKTVAKQYYVDICKRYFNIGKMIEIIKLNKIRRETGEWINREWIECDKFHCRKWWFIQKNDIYTDGLELCDALWEMVKIVLLTEQNKKTGEVKTYKPKFLFGDIVVINKDEIGVILKTWNGNEYDSTSYEVYNRMTNKPELYYEDEIERYKVRHKYLNKEEMQYQEGK